MTTDWSRYRTLRITRQGRILTVALDRPPLNAVNAEMHEELADVFRDAEADDGSDVVVLTGAGEVFSGGGDLQEMKANYEQGQIRMDRRDAKRIIFSLLDMEKPIVARVNGHAVGLGATLALFCDVIFMSTRATIADPHVSIGIVAGDGGAVIWPQLIGYVRAKEYLMTGRRLSAEQAASIGLVNHAVQPEELDARTYGFAEELANGARDAIRWTKVSVNIGLKQLAHSIMDTSLAYEWATLQSRNHAEAVAAFLEKRKPRFGGD